MIYKEICQVSITIREGVLAQSAGYKKVAKRNDCALRLLI